MALRSKLHQKINVLCRESLSIEVELRSSLSYDCGLNGASLNLISRCKHLIDQIGVWRVMCECVRARARIWVMLGTLLGQVVCPGRGVSFCPAPQLPACLLLIFPQSVSVVNVQTYSNKSNGVS
jgi:hypothetical protein